jgi:hypothetical protein
MEIVPSAKKDGILVFYQGYLYRKDREFVTTISWRCTVKGCKGRLSTNRDLDQEPTVRGDHLHAPDPARAEVKKVQATVCDRALSSLDPPRRIIQDQAGTLSQEAAVNIR